MNRKILIVGLVFTSTAMAHQDLIRTPFVVASRRGLFYAKVVEADKKATVYKVAAAEDIPVYALDWDASEMFLAEVDVGTVAVTCRSWIGPEDAQRNAPVLSFYLNGKIQKEYSLESMLGPKVKERVMHSETMERVFAAVPGFMEVEQAIPYTYRLEKPRLVFQVQTPSVHLCCFKLRAVR